MLWQCRGEWTRSLSTSMVSSWPAQVVTVEEVEEVEGVGGVEEVGGQVV